VTEHCEVVFDTLKEIGANEVPSLLVFNKSDRPEAQAALPGLTSQFPEAIPISALHEEGLDLLKQKIAEMIPMGAGGRGGGGRWDGK
jgi:GTP-binding protein HflX